MKIILRGLLALENLCIKPGGPGLYNKKYGCWLAHDFTEREWHNNAVGLAVTENVDEMVRYSNVCAYYKRRIERFYKVFELGVPIYLFRSVIRSHEARQLYTLLKKRFPNSSFTLVCIESEGSKPFEPIGNWQIPGVIHFRTEYAHFEGRFSQQAKKEWGEFFNRIGLIKP